MRRSGKRLLGSFVARSLSGQGVDVDNIYKATDPSLTGDQMLVLRVLKEMGVSQQDQECLYTVLNSIIGSLPSIMVARISIKGGLDNFTLQETEVEKVLSSVKLCAEQYDTEIYKLFLAEKFEILKRNYIRTFINSVVDDLRKYLKVEEGKDKESNITPNGLVIQYILRSAGFKNLIKILCSAMLGPSQELLNLVILLDVKDFNEDMGKEDFARVTLTQLSDKISKYGKLAEEDIKFLAAKLFEKHKYLYVYENFSEAIDQLCIALCSTSDSVCDRKAQIEIELERFFDEFQCLETKVIEKYNTRLSQGLLQWKGIDELKCQLARDLFPRTKERVQLLYAINYGATNRKAATTSLETISIAATEAAAPQIDAARIEEIQCNSVSLCVQGFGRGS